MKVSRNTLNRIIAESVTKVLREYDEPFPYDYKDAREREAYFERACKHDFRQEGMYKIGRTWEDTYYTLLDKKQKIDKEQARIDKEQARADKLAQKQQALAQKRQDAWRAKQDREIMWAHAVDIAFSGNDDEEADFDDNFYDGIVDFPLYFRDGTYTTFHADSINAPNEEFKKKNDVPTLPCSFLFLGGTVDGGSEDEYVTLDLCIVTYDSPMDLEVKAVQCSLGELSMRTKMAIQQIGKREAVRCYKQLKANQGKLGGMRAPRAWDFGTYPQYKPR